jgi:hypothetical protein
MLRPFLLSLIVFGAGASGVGQASQPSDVATWRFEVSAILDAQRGDGATVSPAVAGSYGQPYQRYEGQSQPAAPAGH